MPPVSESNRYTTADLELSQCADKRKKVNNEGSKDHTTTTEKPAHDNDETASLKTTQEPKNDQEKQVKSTSELNKNHLKAFKFDDYVEKLNEVIKNEFIQRQPESHHLDDLEDEEAAGYSGNKATAEMDIPTELEAAYVWKEDIQGVTKYSEDGETPREEGDSGEDDEHEESVASKPTCAQPQETQRNHAGGEDSEVPVGEPTESSTSEINKAMFVVTVANTHFKPYGSMDPLQLPIDEIKVSEESTSLLQIVLPNDNLLQQLSNEEQTQNVNTSSVLVVNQQPKHLENEASTQSISDVPTPTIIEKLQVGTSVYPYFSALAGPASESPEGLSHDDLEPQDCGESNDTVTLEGPVSDHSLFQSDFADAINPDT